MPTPRTALEYATGFRCPKRARLEVEKARRCASDGTKKMLQSLPLHNLGLKELESYKNELEMYGCNKKLKLSDEAKNRHDALVILCEELDEGIARERVAWMKDLAVEREEKRQKEAEEERKNTDKVRVVESTSIGKGGSQKTIVFVDASLV